ncbi:hypothetical protein VTN77DRAFT_9778 [Rasamsonia byssochlamydoides]|uniref:uncharacterized protein n=1 Tax=Rasamsonia byssochlamydoides TaxID=89139 RepID=UPI0037433C11
MNVFGWGNNHHARALRPNPVQSPSLSTVQKVEDIAIDDTEYPILPRDVAKEALPFIDATEVRKRDGKNHSRLWIVIDDIVYDCSSFVHKHPGGEMPIRNFAGKSCSWQFHRVHGSGHLKMYAEAFRVGRTEGVENPYPEPERQQSKPLRFGANGW